MPWTAETGRLSQDDKAEKNLEVLPTVVAEAMHARLPIITPQHPASPDVVHSTVEPENPPSHVTSAILRYQADATAGEPDTAGDREITARIPVGDATMWRLTIPDKVATP